MKITSVSYKRLKNLGNFENESVEATGGVGNSESPEICLHGLKSWVHNQLGLSAPDVQAEVNDLERTRDALKSDIQFLDTNYKHAQRRWLKAEEFMKRLGLETPQYTDDMPF